MRMCPLFSETGQLLGHVDLDRCRRARDHLVVDNASLTVSGGRIDESMTVDFIQLFFREIRFRNERADSTLTYIVVDSELPKWFWKAPGTVEFYPAHWGEV